MILYVFVLFFTHSCCFGVINDEWMNEWITLGLGFWSESRLRLDEGRMWLRDVGFVGKTESYSVTLGKFSRHFVLQQQFCGISGLGGAMSSTECRSTIEMKAAQAILYFFTFLTEFRDIYALNVDRWTVVLNIATYWYYYYSLLRQMAAYKSCTINNTIRTNMN